MRGSFTSPSRRARQLRSPRYPWALASKSISSPHADPNSIGRIFRQFWRLNYVGYCYSYQRVSGQLCRSLLAEVPDERMTEQPMPGVNHPAWVLGHLAVVADGISEKLGGKKTLPTTWPALFASGSKPSATRSLYPSREELLRALEQRYEDLRQRAATASPEQLSQPTTSPRAKETLPTFKEFLAFLLTGHVGVHVGQLSSWRRMIGLPPLF